MEKKVYSWKLPLCVAKALVLKVRAHLRESGFEELLSYTSPSGPDTYEIKGPKGNVFITVTSLGPDMDEVRIEADFPMDELIREAVQSLVEELQKIPQSLS